MPDESFAVRRKIGLERGYDWRQYAADALTHGSSLIEHLESSIQYRESSLRHRQKKAEDASNVFVAVNARECRIVSIVARDCVPSYTVPMRRRKRTPLRLSEPKLHHNVYVVLLSKAALKDLSIMRRNPARDPVKPAVYVGMTGLPVDHRFENHKNGYKSARLVRKYGVRLLPELYEHLNPMPYEYAVQMEKDLADDLRAQGYAVCGGT